MPRSLWRGAISFGLIYVPVNLFSASKDNALPMHLLDSRDFAPVGYHRINKVTGKEVDWPHIVKGYEYKKGQYVALSDADFKHANVKASETIEIVSFTDADQIPPLYFSTPYYLTPSKGGQKVYSLLRRTLQETKKVAVATFVMRGRQHLCAVAPDGDSLVLLTLRFSNEVLPPVSVSNDEAAGKSKDTYRDDLLHRVKEKIKKKQTHSLEAEKLPESGRPKAQVMDLMEALRNSLEKNKGAARAAPKKATRQRKQA